MMIYYKSIMKFWKDSLKKVFANEPEYTIKISKS